MDVGNHIAGTQLRIRCQFGRHHQVRDFLLAHLRDERWWRRMWQRREIHQVLRSLNQPDRHTLALQLARALCEDRLTLVHDLHSPWSALEVHSPHIWQLMQAAQVTLPSASQNPLVTDTAGTSPGLEYKLGRVIARLGSKLGPEIASQFKALLQPQALATLAAALALVAAAQLTPWGWLGDEVLLTAAIAAMGMTAWQLADELFAFLTVLQSASDEAGYDRAAQHLATAITLVGVELVLALLMRGVGRSRRAGRRVEELWVEALYQPDVHWGYKKETPPISVLAKSEDASSIPLGFGRALEFETFGRSLYVGLRAAGYKNADAAFQGSSVTGLAFKPPHDPFDVGRISDYDSCTVRARIVSASQSCWNWPSPAGHPHRPIEP